MRSVPGEVTLRLPLHPSVFWDFTGSGEWAPDAKQKFQACFDREKAKERRRVGDAQQCRARAGSWACSGLTILGCASGTVGLWISSLPSQPVGRAGRCSRCNTSNHHLSHPTSSGSPLNSPLLLNGGLARGLLPGIRSAAKHVSPCLSCLQNRPLTLVEISGWRRSWRQVVKVGEQSV